MIKKTLFLLFIIFSFNGYSQSDYFKTVKESESFSERMTKLFSENKPSEAFDEMKNYWPLPATELDLIKKQTLKGLNLMESRFGKPIGITNLKHITLGDVAYRDIYLVRYNVTALRFIYTYYKNDNGLLLNSFKFDEDFDEEF